MVAYQQVARPDSRCVVLNDAVAVFFVLDGNKLRGTIPRGLFHNQFVALLSIGSNELSGTIGMIEPPQGLSPFPLSVAISEKQVHRHFFLLAVTPAT